MSSRLYVAVRADLPPGLQMAQAVHAAFGFAHDHPEITAEWLRDSQFVVVVSVPDEHSLVSLAATAVSRELATVLWHEPDIDDELTAIAIAPSPEATRLCSSLPLAGRQLVDT